jgi:hypothetical protein
MLKEENAHLKRGGVNMKGIVVYDTSMETPRKSQKP